MTRDAWHLRANVPTFGYLLAAVVVAAARPYLAHPTWLLVHVLLLGAATNAILVWSAHFTQTLLRLPAATGRRGLAIRILVLNAGVLLVLTGYLVPGAAVVGGVALWQAWVLWRQMHAALPARFRPMVRFYVAAACLLPVGAALGAALATERPDADQARLLLAHQGANILGWIGLTVAGTLVTLWPTMLRTRIADGAERAAGRALPVLVASVVTVVAAAVLGLRVGVAIALAGYLAGWAVLAWPHARQWRRRPPRGFAPWSTLAAVAWLWLGLAGALVVIAATPAWPQIEDRLDVVLLPFAAGFGAQILLGALTFLIPAVLGGGPLAARRTIAVLETAAAVRVVGANAGLLLLAGPWDDRLRLAGGVLALVSMAGFLPIAAAAVVVNRRTRRP